MTDEEINLAIAESKGWTKCYKGCDGKTWRLPDDSGCQQSLPDYCNDLNLMHEVEKGLDDAIHKVYRRELRFVTGCGASTTTELELDNRRFFDATARQRAEAYLRTIGKWKS